MSCRFGDRDDDIQDVLERNIGRVVTVFTESGGRAGSGFTGVVSDVNDDTVRLVSASPIGRIDAFDDFDPLEDRRRGRRCDHDDRHRRFTTLTIPLDKISCVATRHF